MQWPVFCLSLARQLLVLLVLLGNVPAAHATCSPWAGKLTINEYNLLTSNNPSGSSFAEIKFVDPAVLSAVKNGTWSFAGWTMSITRANGAVATKDLGAIYTSPVYATNNYCAGVSVDLYFRVPFAESEATDEANVVLLDNNGYMVDELRAAMKKNSTVANYYTPPVSPKDCKLCEKATKNATCSPNSSPQLLLDTDYISGNANSQKNIQRFPDGTGIWKEAMGGGNNSEDTLCTTNDNILLVTKTASAYSVAQGGSVSYTITVKNGSATTAMTGVTVTDIIPVNLSFQSRTISTGSTNTLSVGATNPSTLTWTVGSLAINATATMTVTAAVTTGGVAITNVAEATSTELSGATTQGSATINALQVAASTTPSSINVNGTTTYAITVTNTSSSAIYDVIATLPFPNGVTYVSNTLPSQGTFTHTTDANQVWSIGALAAGASVTLNVTAQGTQTGTFTVTTSAISNTNYPGAVYTGSASLTVAAPAGAFTLNAPDFKAGDGVQGTITAPQSGGAPVSGFAGTTRKVKFYYTATTPASPSGTMKMDAWEGATNTTASVGAVAGTLAGSVVRDVYFDAGGVGKFDLNFDNVGQFSLYADWQGSYESSPPAGAPSSITGNDAFVVTPYRYDVVPTVSSSTVSTAAGGSAFDLTVTAQALCKAGWGYTCTVGTYTTATNFSGTAAADVSLSVATGSLTNVPNFWCSSASIANVSCSTTAASGLTIQAGAFVNGTYTLSGVQWSEVGAAALTATSSYLGTTSASNVGNTVNFYPQRFAASQKISAPSGDAVAAPGPYPFIYYGQGALTIGETITAQVTAPAGAYSTAKNYSGGGAYSGTLATVRFVAKNAGTDINVYPDSTVAVSTQLNGTSCTWSSGLCVYSTATGTLARATSPEAPADVNFTVTITDTESKVNACVKTVAPATCTQSVNVFTADYGTIQARYGRVSVANAFGSEMLPLSVPVTMQYYNSSGVWVTNTAHGDSTSSWPVTPSGTNALEGASASGSTSADPVISSASGSTILTATAPGTGGFGYKDITLTVPDYLRFPWTGATATNPTTRVTFGIYKQTGKSNRIIYRREVR
jgi:uncharacterized repeat protein (TIGR01451 family)